MNNSAEHFFDLMPEDLMPGMYLAFHAATLRNSRSLPPAVFRSRGSPK